MKYEVDTAALRAEANELRAAAGMQYNAEYPRRAANVRRDLADALDAQAATWEATADAASRCGRDRASKQARRAARLERLAAAALVESCRLDMRSHAIGELRPFGQPILVGHHSEKRHRRDVERQHGIDRKRWQLWEKAKRLRQKAEACRTNGAIYSDDSNAAQLIQQKIDALEHERERRKAVNAAYRRAKGDLDLMHLPESEYWRLRRDKESYYMGPDKWRPYASYYFSNVGAEIRRLKARLVKLEEAANRVERPDRTIGDVVVRDNLEFGKVELHFPGKPDELVRTRLKQWGFRWIRSAGCWSRSIGAETEMRLAWLQELLKGDEVNA